MSLKAILPCPEEESPLGDLLCLYSGTFELWGRLYTEWPAKIGSLVVRLCDVLEKGADAGIVPYWDRAIVPPSGGGGGATRFFKEPCRFIDASCTEEVVTVKKYWCNA